MTIKVKGLYALHKSPKVGELIKNDNQNDSYVHTRDWLQTKRNTKTKSKGMKINIPCKWKWKKKAGVAILISDKIGCNKWQRWAFYNDKGSMQQEDVTLINIYTPNVGAHKYIKQILMGTKGEINSNTVIIGGFNSPLITMDRSSKQKINKETVALNDSLQQMELIDNLEDISCKSSSICILSNYIGNIFQYRPHVRP